jgi:hypothetical protein
VSRHWWRLRWLSSPSSCIRHSLRIYTILKERIYKIRYQCWQNYVEIENLGHLKYTAGYGGRGCSVQEAVIPEHSHAPDLKGLVCTARVLTLHLVYLRGVFWRVRGRYAVASGVSVATAPPIFPVHSSSHSRKSILASIFNFRFCQSLCVVMCIYTYRMSTSFSSVLLTKCINWHHVGKFVFTLVAICPVTEILNSFGFNPRVNHTDRVTAACWRS